MYHVNLKSLKDKLKLKILSIYVIDEAKKQEYIDMVESVNHVDILFEIDQRLNDVMKDLGKLAVQLIEGADKTVIAQFKALINAEILKSLHEKENESKLLEQEELAQLEENLEALLEKI